jgi:hypothetical protein
LLDARAQGARLRSCQVLVEKVSSLTPMAVQQAQGRGALEGNAWMMAFEFLDRAGTGLIRGQVHPSTTGLLHAHGIRVSGRAQ